MKSRLILVTILIACLGVKSQDPGTPHADCDAGEEERDCLTSTTFLKCVSGNDGLLSCECPTSPLSVWEDLPLPGLTAHCARLTSQICTSPKPNAEPPCVLRSGCRTATAESTCTCNYGYLPDVNGRCIGAVALVGQPCGTRGSPSSASCTLGAICKNEADDGIRDNICECLPGHLLTATRECVSLTRANVGQPCHPNPSQRTHIPCVAQNAECVGQVPTATCTCKPGYPEITTGVNSGQCARPAIIGAPCTDPPTYPGRDPLCNIKNAECDVYGVCACRANYEAAGNACTLMVKSVTTIGADCFVEPTEPEHGVCQIPKASCVVTLDGQKCLCDAPWSPNDDNTTCSEVSFPKTEYEGPCFNFPTATDQSFCNIANGTCLAGKCVCPNGFAVQGTGDSRTCVAESGSAMIVVSTLIILFQQAFVGIIR